MLTVESSTRHADARAPGMSGQIFDPPPYPHPCAIWQGWQAAHDAPPAYNDILQKISANTNTLSSEHDAQVKPSARSAWTRAEDDVLCKLVGIHGCRWQKIAGVMQELNGEWPWRNGKRCRERWRNFLRPKPRKVRRGPAVGVGWE